ncbi:MAG: DUF3187 family protein [Planctomycetes bacterium]|nr:DUF3187 family protein [Planctomycetota bacterium]
MNGFNIFVGVPELTSAFLLPEVTDWAWDYQIEYGSYEENCVKRNQILRVDTSIVKMQLDTTVRFQTFFKNSLMPIDFRLGIPLIQWSDRPYFTFNNGQTEILDGQKPDLGLGDIFLDTKLAIYCREGMAVSGLLRLKLPTGDALNLTGSGSAALSTTLLYSQAMGLHRWNGNLGIVLAGKAKNFKETPQVTMKNILHFGVDYGYRFKGETYALVSLEGHQNAFHGFTELSVLEDPPLSMGVGLAYNLLKFRYYAGIKMGLNGASADQQFLFSIKTNY